MQNIIECSASGQKERQFVFMSKKKSRKSHKKTSAKKQFVQKNTTQSEASVYSGRDSYSNNSASQPKTSVLSDKSQSKAAEVQALHNKYQSAITKTERKTQVNPQKSTSAESSAPAEKVILYGNKPKATASSSSSSTYITTKTHTSIKKSSKSSDGFIETPQVRLKTAYTPAPYPVIEQTEKVKQSEKTAKLEKNEKTATLTPAPTPTFEDWQSEQKQRIEEAFEKKQAELKLKTVELELNEASKPHRHFGRWLAASFATLLLVAACSGGAWWFLTNYHPAEKIEVPTTSLATAEIDFGQSVINADGDEFTPVYQRGGLKKDLFIKFANLKCNEQCTNVQNLRFADNELIPGLDYNLVGENLSFTLYADFLEQFEAGVYELTFDYLDDSSEAAQSQKIGLHVTIEAVELVCEDSQTLQDGVCVDEKGEEVAQPAVRVLPMPEKSSNSEQQSSNTDSNQEPTTTPTPEQPTTPAEQLACERRNGPKYLTIVHWATEAEKEQALATNQIDPTLTFIEGGFNTETKLATMKWVNGICRPAIKAEYLPDSQPGISILMSLDTFRIVGGHLNAYIDKYPNQDLLIWNEADGSIRVEVVANGYAVLEY